METKSGCFVLFLLAGVLSPLSEMETTPSQRNILHHWNNVLNPPCGMETYIFKAY